ncbi:MAG: hypothetical protein GY820_14285 [Gammaproteobacteria bacterium]|nr:hypothetical protein [Gammaproteobacteria bacterium]
MEDKSRRVCELCGQSFNRTAYYTHKNRQTCLRETKKSVQTRLRNKREGDGSRERSISGEVAAGGNGTEEDQLNFFMCPGESCGFSYTTFKTLQGHYRAVHGGTLYAQPPSYSIYCGCCDLPFVSIRALCDHVRHSDDHWSSEGQFSTAPYSISEADFGSNEEFLDWKEQIESETCAEFVRKGRFVGKWWTTDFFYCSRSGQPARSFEEEEASVRPGKRAPPRLPSKKIGFSCTAFIQSKKMDDGYSASLSTCSSIIRIYGQVAFT